MIGGEQRGSVAAERDLVLEHCARALSNERLRLTILPTEKCNFRCAYCYEDFGIGRMQAPVIQGVKNLLRRRFKTLRRLDVNWFGGEPLLAYPVIDEISTFVLDAVKKHRALAYNAAITTNGYMLDANMLTALVSKEIRTFQISLDGDQDEHDRTRLRLDGAGTFGTIWANLLSAAETSHEFTVVLRIHYSEDKIGSLRDLVRQINRLCAGDDRFRVHFAAIEPLGGPKAGAVKKMQEARKKELKKHLASFLSPDVAVYEPVGNKLAVCYAAEANTMVIRANGRLAKCTVALNDVRNDIGNINEDGTLSVDQEKHQRWLLGWESGNRAVLACPASAVVGEFASTGG